MTSVANHEEGNYCKEIIFVPETSIIHNKSGLKPLTKYIFEKWAWSVFQEGKWSEVSEFFGMCLFRCVHQEGVK